MQAKLADAKIVLFVGQQQKQQGYLRLGTALRSNFRNSNFIAFWHTDSRLNVPELKTQKN
jgi:hypothetical protein